MINAHIRMKFTEVVQSMPLKVNDLILHNFFPYRINGECGAAMPFFEVIKHIYAVPLQC